MKQKEYFSNLNALRFFAAFFVIGFHYFSFEEAPLLNTFFKKGYISVPFFYLLSGFVLFHNYKDYDFKNKTFSYLKSRFIRLAPIYYMAMGLAIPLIFYNQRQNPLEVNDYLFAIPMHLTFLQSVIPIKKWLFSWNVHSWSLSVEMTLYIISPLLFIFLKGLNSLAKVLLFFFLCLAINTILFSAALNKEPWLPSSYWSVLYIPTFFMGALLSPLYEYFKKRFLKLSPILFPMLVITLIILFSLEANISYYSSFNPFFQLAFCLLILMSCPTNKSNSWLSHPKLILLGEASYAMYIFQAPLKLLTQQTLSKALNYPHNKGYIYCLAVSGVIIGVSIFVTKKIDPLMRRALKSVI